MKKSSIINELLIVLNSTSGLAEKYPYGNIDLTKKVKEYESMKLIEYNAYLDRWTKSSKRKELI